MPSWCEITLTIAGNIEEVKKLEAFVKKDDKQYFSFDNVIPYPAHWKASDEAWHEAYKKLQAGEDIDLPPNGFNQGGYEWCLNNWGTKWDACHLDCIEPPKIQTKGKDAMLVYIFDTAWSPPTPVIHKLSTMFPGLVFGMEYDIEGGNGAGIIQFLGGEKILDADIAQEEFEEWLDEGE